MILKGIGIIVLSVCSAIFYRVGGASKEAAKEEFPWWPAWAVNGRVRDVGCSLCNWLGLLLLGYHTQWYIHVIAIVLSVFAHSTYYDRIFKHDNHYAHGVGIGLSFLPYAITRSIGWFGFVLRSVVLCLFMGFWSFIFEKDMIEEAGRGAIQPLSLLIL